MAPLLARIRTGRPDPMTDDGQFVDAAGRSGPYLTDGIELYRFLGAIPGGLGQMVGLENCRSFEILLLPIGELRSNRLRAVTPAETAA